jgi:CubicO group peptidase (beta-lactamase class C family)
MDSTRVISEADIIPNRAAGYLLVKGEWKNQTYVAPTINRTGDGSLYLTAVDLAKWDMALTARKLLKPSSYEAMWTPVRLNDGTTYPYGFGWQLAPTNGHKTISHGGSWQGFLTHISRFVDDHLTVIVLVNTDSAETEKIAQGVAARYVPALAASK